MNLQLQIKMAPQLNSYFFSFFRNTSMEARDF